MTRPGALKLLTRKQQQREEAYIAQLNLHHDIIKRIDHGGFAIRQHNQQVII